MAALLIGFFAGIGTGDAIRGVWLGLGFGVIAAVAIWLMDRREG